MISKAETKKHIIELFDDFLDTKHREPDSIQEWVCFLAEEK